MYKLTLNSDYEKQAFLESFNQAGIAYIQDYFNQSDIKGMLDSLELLEKHERHVIKTQWGDKKTVFYSCHKDQVQDHSKDFSHDPYFLQSRQGSHLFFEKHEDSYQINRIGHALHNNAQFPAFKLMIKDKLLDIFRLLRYKRPVCHLSAYIPKLPKGIGSEVNPHQENTFAYTNPTSALVLWIALDDATIDNACMWGIEGSNRWPLKYISKVDKTAHKREFLKINEIEIPDFHTNRDQFTPLEVKAGDALLFHGNFVHCSPSNTSDLPRRCLTLQFIETHGVDYPEFNWIWPCRSDYLYE